MSIDTSKPWFPQDHPVDEVLKIRANGSGIFFPTKKHQIYMSDLVEDHYLRTHGPAGVFFDLRRHIENALHGQQIHTMPQRGEPVVREPLDEDGKISVDVRRFMNTVDEVISLAITKLEGTSIPDTKWVISDYAVPVFTRDQPPDYNCQPTLMEETRPCEDICQKYWDMVSIEESTD